MGDQSNSQPSLTDAVTELIAAGSTLCKLVGIDWTTITLEERREAAERWQRAVLQVATLNMQRSNEATE